MFLVLVPWLMASLGETGEALGGGQKGIRGKFLKATVKFLVPAAFCSQVCYHGNSFLLVLLLTRLPHQDETVTQVHVSL